MSTSLGIAITPYFLAELEAMAKALFMNARLSTFFF